jgi:iron-sulfur cluster repair protein YtfE (RIC family)
MIETVSTIRETFAADHDRLDQLFESYRQAKQKELRQAREFFKEFKIGLQRHIVWEEQVLFPLFERKTGMSQGGPTEVMRQEHRLIGVYLEAVHEKVRNRDPNSDSEDYFLLSALALHNQKEENILYPTLDRLLSDEEKAEAFAAIQHVPEEAYRVCCGVPITAGHSSHTADADR